MYIIILIVRSIFLIFFFSSRRRHTRYWRDWSSDVCSSDLFRQRELQAGLDPLRAVVGDTQAAGELVGGLEPDPPHLAGQPVRLPPHHLDRLVPVGLVDPYRQ